MKLTLILLLLNLALGISYGLNDSFIIIHKSSCDSIQYALNQGGEKIIELPAHHKFIVENTLEADRSIVLEYLHLYDLSRGPLLILAKDYFYLMDSTGTTIKTQKEYGTIYSAWGGFLKARLIKEQKSDRHIYIYLNKYGEPAFKVQKYYFATSFNEGKAIVKSMENEWKTINSKGQTIASIDSTLNSNIFKANSFYNGLALVNTKIDLSLKSFQNNTKYFYIDEKGNAIIDVLEKFGKVNHFPPSNFDE